MRWRDRLSALIRPDGLNRELQAELDLHLEMKRREIEEGGASNQQAERQARLAIGNPSVLKESMRESHTIASIEGTWRDLRYAVRSLRRAPVYTLTVAAILAVAIGANCAVFSLVSALWIRPLPYPDSGRLFEVMGVNQKGQRDYIDNVDFREFGRRSQAFEDFSGWLPQSANLTGEGEPVRVRAGFVSDNFFTILGAKPHAGRLFLPGEDRPGGPRIVVLSHGVWQTRYGGEPDILGKAIQVNGEPLTVVGVLPDEFVFPIDHFDIWLPYCLYPSFRPERGAMAAMVTGKLKEGFSTEQRNEDLKRIAAQLDADDPIPNAKRGFRTRPLQEALFADYKPMLRTLWFSVGLLLLMACANLANLTLSRACARTREFSIRGALGASRAQLIRQLAAETVLLAIAGVAGGLLLGKTLLFFALERLRDNLPPDLPVKVDIQTLVFSVAISLTAAILFGLTPLLSVAATGTRGSQGFARAHTLPRGAQRSRQALMTAQIAISFALLCTSGFLLKSLGQLGAVDPGLRVDNVLTLEYRMPKVKYPGPEQQANFHKLVAERVAAIPGVRSATVALNMPFGGNSARQMFLLPGQPVPPKGTEPVALINRIDPSYFETLGIPLLDGRAFSSQDRIGGAPVAIVNRLFVDRYFEGRSPVGQQLRFPDTPGFSPFIVGVVGATPQFSLEERLSPQLYIPMAQMPHIFGTLAVHTAADPLALTSAVRTAVWAVDPDQPMWKIRSMRQLYDRNFLQGRILGGFIGTMSAIAIVLAALGIYGVLSYWTSQRRREIGVRLAVGATPRRVILWVMRQSAGTILIGTIAGIGLCVALGQYLESVLYKVRANDFPILAGAAALIAAVGFTAAYLPARGAAHVDPTEALRPD